MHRFYTPPDDAKGSPIVLSRQESHHATKVLRLKAGEQVTVLDGAGSELLCEVVLAGKHTVQLNVIQKKSHPPLPCRLTLIQALPKGKAMDLIVQKATELGAHRIVPVIAERSVAQVDGANAGAKVEKWLAVGVESIKQCGSPWLPKIDAPLPLSSFLAKREKSDLSLVGSLQGDACHARKYFQEFQARHQRRPADVAVWIGPEGDFTPDEMAAIQAGGALPITMGPLILRCDTAAITSLAVVSYELQA
jgi:16S rRNA (uracil1498-N3)-methyltransferase